MRIDIQKELKDNRWAEEVKYERKRYVGYMIGGIISFAIVLVDCYAIGMAYKKIIPKTEIDTGAFVGVCGLFFIFCVFGMLAYGFFANLANIRYEINSCEYHLKWLNDHKEYDYAVGEVWQSLDECTFIKKGEE